MTKHVHAEMIKAKADNMELVIFVKYDEGWALSGYEELICLSDREFFICLPKHNENGQCKHWLNGGGVELSHGGVEFHAESKFNGCWSSGISLWYNNPNCISRIKPSKEKRWIAVFKSGDYFCTTELSYKTLEALKSDVYAPNGFDHWQFIEIEVEV